jgi:hypothetical protein
MQSLQHILLLLLLLLVLLCISEFLDSCLEPLIGGYHISVLLLELLDLLLQLFDFVQAPIVTLSEIRNLNPKRLRLFRLLLNVVLMGVVM